MTNARETVGELSKMNRELNRDTLVGLEGNREGYATRLKAVADHTFMNGRNVRGTTIGAPGILTLDKRGRTREIDAKTSMYVREIYTPEGKLSMFPFHIIAVSYNGTPIIDPDIEGSYSVVHLPKIEGQSQSVHDPCDMRADLTFTVDRDNLITVDGNTAVEIALFDDIVEEFERLAYQ
jgi:hypothetical protein